MKKLYEILGQRLANGDVGIEIEMEGHDFPAVVNDKWKITVDGSLRGENREFVFAKPLPVGEVKGALTDLKKALKAAGTEIDFSFRTSVHVHVNCQDLTYVQYLNFLYTYMLLEEPLITFCGKERKGNRFCLRLQDAEGMLDTYHNLFTMGQAGFEYIPADHVRYSAMNIEATTKFGSLEFRGMAGCMDVERIDTWANALVYIREFARGCKDPSDVYAKYAELEAMGFMEAVLKEYTPAFYYPRASRDIQQSFSLSIDLPFAYGEYARKEAERIKEKEAYAKAMAALKEEQQKREADQAARPPVPRKVVVKNVIQGHAPVQYRVRLGDDW